MRNKALDLGRLIAALLVIIIHAPLPGLTGQLAESLARVAVPFFFLISGYYCFDKHPEQLKKKIRRTAVLLLWSVVLYITWSLVMSLRGDGIAAKLQSYFSLQTLVETFVLNTGIILGHLWFVLALLYCYCIYAYWLRKASFGVKLGIGLFLAAAFFIVREVLQANGIANPVYYIRNFLFVGLPFFLLGEVIAQKQDRLASIKSIYWVLAAFIGLAAAAAERLTLGVCDLYLGTVLASVSIFILLQRCTTWKGGLFSRWGGKYSGDIYVFHMIGITVTTAAGSLLGLLENPVFLYIRPFVVLMICIIIASAKDKLLHIVAEKPKGRKTADEHCS